MSCGREPNEPTFVGVPVDRALRQTEPPLTKRELFAAMAMQAIVSRRDSQVVVAGGDDSAKLSEMVAAGSVAYADALLKQLNRGDAAN